MSKKCPKCHKDKSRIFNFSYFGVGGLCDECVVIENYKKIQKELEEEELKEIKEEAIHKIKVDEMIKKLKSERAFGVRRKK
jgi:hypothetical protein